MKKILAWPAPLLQKWLLSLLLCLPFLLNNFLILFAQYTPINISPFDYLIAFNDAPHKRPFMLLVFFGVMLLAAALLTPVCLKKLRRS